MPMPRSRRTPLPVVSPLAQQRIDALLGDVEVASPCTADWNGMAGDDQVRFCGLCQKNVYNFAGMTRLEIFELLATTDGSVCGRFYKRPDGTLLTADCPIGRTERARRMARRTWRASVAFAGMLVGAMAQALWPAPKPACQLVDDDAAPPALADGVASQKNQKNDKKKTVIDLSDVDDRRSDVDGRFSGALLGALVVSDAAELQDVFGDLRQAGDVGGLTTTVPVSGDDADADPR